MWSLFLSFNILCRREGFHVVLTQVISLQIQLYICQLVHVVEGFGRKSARVVHDCYVVDQVCTAKRLWLWLSKDQGMIACKPNRRKAHTKLIECLTNAQVIKRRRDPFAHILADCISSCIAKAITLLQLDLNVQSRLCQVSHFVARHAKNKWKFEMMRCRFGLDDEQLY